MKTRARLIAFHLPQFHPTPENDAWWGRGFTEWTNVAKCEPQFPGHDQPRLPADLGYYDLRVPEVRAQQAAMAREHGIEAFCYWHYWFGGKRLLERPVNEILASGQPDFPFCLAWANETWSRRWLGEDKDILAKQVYSVEDDQAHAAWLAEGFADPRWLRIDGHPVFAIYRPGDLPDPKRFADALRAACKKKKIPRPHIIGINSHHHHDWTKRGLDANLDFEPQLGVMPNVMASGLKVFDYATGRQLMHQRKRDYAFHPCIFTGWDNTPRRGKNAIVFVDSTPELFAAGLDEMISSVEKKPFAERIVFVNAWNEWAEGNYLEPDQKRGRTYLEAVRRVNGSE